MINIQKIVANHAIWRHPVIVSLIKHTPLPKLLNMEMTIWHGFNDTNTAGHYYVYLILSSLASYYTIHDIINGPKTKSVVIKSAKIWLIGQNWQIYSAVQSMLEVSHMSTLFSHATGYRRFVSFSTRIGIFEHPTFRHKIAILLICKMEKEKQKNVEKSDIRWVAGWLSQING